MKKIAVTMPGKIGDLLYALPTVRHISKIFGQKVDFWTSHLCSPILPLLNSQSYIDETFIATKYVPEHDNCGVQPFVLQPEKEYDRVYMLGFREYPSCRLVDYFPTIYGFEHVDKTIKYDILSSDKTYPDIVVCPGRSPLLKPVIYKILNTLGEANKIAQIGPSSELINLNLKNVKNYEYGMLETLEVLNGAKLFVGTLSANLVLANGFSELKKIVLVEPERHNQTHDIISSNHHYINYNNIEEILEKCKNLITV